MINLHKESRWQRIVRFVGSKLSCRGLLLYTKIAIALVPCAIMLFILNQHYIIFSRAAVYVFTPFHSRNSIFDSSFRNSLNPAYDPKTNKVTWLLPGGDTNAKIRINRMVERLRIRFTLETVGNPTIVFSSPGKSQTITNIIRSNVFDTLDWPKISADGVTLWQRENRTYQKKTVSVNTTSKDKTSETVVTTVVPIKQFNSMEEFRKNRPSSNKIAVVGLHPLSMASLPDYKPANGPITFPDVFRGPQAIYFYAAAGEDIKISFDKVDMNRYKGNDPMTVIVRRAEDTRITSSKATYRKVINDDGDTSNQNHFGPKQPVTINIPNAAGGFYELDIVTGDDVTIKNLTTSQTYFNFVDHLYFATGPAYERRATFTPISIIADGSKLDFVTSHGQGLQQIAVDDKTYQYNAMKSTLSINTKAAPTIIRLEKGDMKIDTRGYFAIQPAKLIPTHGAVALSADMINVSLEPYDYVLVDYVPNKDKTTTKFDRTYNLSELKTNAGKSTTFTFSVPGLVNSSQTVEIKSVCASFIRDHWLISKLWGKVCCSLNQK